MDQWLPGNPLVRNLKGDSPFVDAASAEAWDAWFRWREAGELRDLTVDATVQRVASALATVEAEDRSQWTRRFGDSLGAWRLLLDERILASAGTDRVGWSSDGLVACLNVVAFLRKPSSGRASFHREAFVEAAELAVRALDNAAMVAGGGAAPSLRIGLLGLADALALLGLGYRSDEGRAQAQAVARALAEGCFRGAVRLACERGAVADDADATFARAGARELPPALIEAGMRHGVRYHRLTAITSQPRLALLANNVADALDPLPHPTHSHTIETAGTTQVVSSPGYAVSQRRRLGAVDGTSAFEHIGQITVPDQLTLRAALQPWIDAPIDYPVCAAEAPAPAVQQQWQEFAASLGLGRVSWRRCAALGPAPIA